jgi:hypothetical protein
MCYSAAVRSAKICASVVNNIYRQLNRQNNHRIAPSKPNGSSNFAAWQVKPKWTPAFFGAY